jgi:sec-independent protein translocase protein TatC
LSLKESLLAQDDGIDQSKAPLLEHLIELRKRLLWCFGAILIFFLICYIFAQDIYNILVIPYRLAVGFDTPIEMIYTAPQEFFFTQLRLALFGAIFLAFPVIAVQIYKFVAPGLYRNERAAFVPFLIATPVLFLLGGALVFFIIMPLAMSFFLSMQQTGDGQVQIQLTARVSEYLSLIMTLIMAFGITFQLPVVLTLLARAGIVSSTWLREKWKYAVVLIFTLAAFLTPPDVISQIGLAVPTLLLYELSIYSVKLVERRRAAASAAANDGVAGEGTSPSPAE